MIVCAREECRIEFLPKTHNQKYCGAECCRVETNRRIMEKYYAKRDQRLGKTRHCDECGVTKLSRYNDSNVCGSCQIKASEESKKDILSWVTSISA